jgi:hypothetical protein
MLKKLDHLPTLGCSLCGHVGGGCRVFKPLGKGFYGMGGRVFKIWGEGYLSRPLEVHIRLEINYIATSFTHPKLMLDT